MSPELAAESTRARGGGSTTAHKADAARPSARVANTRPRDYCNVRMLWLPRGGELDFATLGEALKATATKRGTLNVMNSWHGVMARVEQDPGLLRQWSAYARRYPYVDKMTFSDACEIMSAIRWDNGTPE